MFTWIAGKFGSTVLEYVVGGAVVIILVGGGWATISYLHNRALKAEAREATAKQALQIGYEGYVKLYQEREAIKARASKKRGQINASTLDDLINRTNAPDGVRRPMLPNSQGGVKTPTLIRDSEGTEFIY
jgi:hypothetical protein